MQTTVKFQYFSILLEKYYRYHLIYYLYSYMAIIEYSGDIYLNI